MFDRAAKRAQRNRAALLPNPQQYEQLHDQVCAVRIDGGEGGRSNKDVNLYKITSMHINIF